MGDEGQKKVYDAWYTAAGIVGILGACFLAGGDDPVGLTFCGISFSLVCFRKWAGRGIDGQ